MSVHIWHPVLWDIRHEHRRGPSLWLSLRHRALTRIKEIQVGRATLVEKFRYSHGILFTIVSTWMHARASTNAHRSMQFNSPQLFEDLCSDVGRGYRQCVAQLRDMAEMRGVFNGSVQLHRTLSTSDSNSVTAIE